MLQPPFSPKKNVFLKLCVLKPKTFMLNKKKHNLKSGETKIRKRDLKGKTRKETIKKKKRLMKQINCNFKFSCCSFQKNKSKEEGKMKRRQNKKQKESKKERQEGRKKDKNKRETEKEKQKKREVKKG